MAFKEVKVTSYIFELKLGSLEISTGVDANNLINAKLLLADKMKGQGKYKIISYKKTKRVSHYKKV
jgi:hypothetical protein